MLVEHACRLLGRQRDLHWGTVTRIDEPREPVTPGGRGKFASDVQGTTPRCDRADHGLLVHRLQAAFLSWSGGQAKSVNARTWTRVAAELQRPGRRRGGGDGGDR